MSVASHSSTSLLFFLSHPLPLPQSQAKSTPSRLTPSTSEKAARQTRLTAVRTLECIGEDPDREGLLRTLTPKVFDYARFYFANNDAGAGFYYSNTSPNVKLHMKIPIIPCREMDW
jgi:hypothetical protein